MVRPVDIYIPQTHLEPVKLYLKEQGIESHVAIPDVGGLISQQRRENRQDGEMNWDNYQTYDTVRTNRSKWCKSKLKPDKFSTA